MAMKYYSKVTISKSLIAKKYPPLSFIQNVNNSKSKENCSFVLCSSGLGGYQKKQYLGYASSRKKKDGRFIHSLVKDDQKIGVFSSFKHDSHQIKEKSPIFTYRIIEDTQRSFVDSSDQRNYFRHDDVEISIDNNPKIVFNLTWLRHSCRCNECLHKHSRQRMNDLTKYDRTSFQLKTCNRLNNDKTSVIHIDWADGHQSIFHLDWLKKAANSSTSFGAYLDSANLTVTQSRLEIPNDDFYTIVGRDKESNKIFWTGDKIDNILTPIEYTDLMDQTNGDTAAIYTLIKELYQYGLAKIVNVPTKRDQLLSVARRLSYERPTGYGTTFDVIAEPNDNILAYTAKEFDLHCDLPYKECLPGAQMLHCLINSQQGGESYFCDAFNACEQLKQQNIHYYNILSRMPVTFSVIDPYRKIKLRQHWPIIMRNYLGQIERVHYSPFMLPPLGRVDQLKLFYEAYYGFSKLLHNNENKFITKMSPGDLYVFQNGRVLHGRNHYDSHKSKRFLQGCYMDWDEIEGLYERFYL